MSTFKINDLVKYDYQGSIYYIRVTNPGIPTDPNFYGKVEVKTDSNWTPFDARSNPDKIIHLVNSEDRTRWNLVNERRRFKRGQTVRCIYEKYSYEVLVMEDQDEHRDLFTGVVTKGDEYNHEIGHESQMFSSTWFVEATDPVAVFMNALNQLEAKL